MIFRVQENTITAHGQIFEGNGMEFLALFAELESQYEQIEIKLHSYGGSVFDGNLMYNAIQNSKKDINLIILGIAASMAAIISQSRKDMKPKMVRNGFLMIHAPSGSTYGGALDHENNGKLLRSIETNCIQLLSTSLSKPKSYVSKWMVGDNWFDAEQALKEGLISEIIEPESDTMTANLNPQELGAQGMYYQFTALLTPKNELPINLDHTMKKPIIEALALTGVNEQSSDTAVIEAVKQHMEAKTSGLQGKLDAEIKKRETAEAALTAHSKTAIDAVIEAAKKDGKITAEQIPTYEGIATASGIEVLKTVLGAIPVRKSITGQMTGSGKSEAATGRESWGFDKWQKEDPKGFEALAKDEPEAFKSLLNAKYQK
jgi:ATP-dependent Clp endopeptidase proteolytic subunit ClpP